MKAQLYLLIARIADSLLAVNMFIGNAIVSIIGGIFNFITFIVGSCSSFFLRSIDENRYNHGRLMLQQVGELSELKILAQIVEVKENALQNRAWTAMHSIAINQLGTALHVNCGWPPARIHGYIKPIIESIPGMVYMGGDEYSENQ